MKGDEVAGFAMSAQSRAWWDSGFSLVAQVPFRPPSAGIDLRPLMFGLR